MPRPVGSGKPKGYKAPKTLEKAAFTELVRAELAPHAQAFAAALTEAALGVKHLIARERDGSFTQVTDPKVMVKVLNSGETFYKIHARDPDVNALDKALTRLCGPVERGAIAVNATDTEITLRWAVASS